MVHPMRVRINKGIIIKKEEEERKGKVIQN